METHKIGERKNAKTFSLRGLRTPLFSLKLQVSRASQMSRTSRLDHGRSAVICVRSFQIQNELKNLDLDKKDRIENGQILA